MHFDTIAFTSAEPKTAWIEGIIFDVLSKMPSKLFDESRTWDTIITQYPFIHEFNVPKAKEIVFSIRQRKTVSNEPIFPLDARENESNVQQFIERKPLRIMITGDVNASFFEIAELLVMNFNTYHITPKELIKRQIARNTKMGKWLLWNLKQERGIPTWVVLKLLESELKNDKYVHKGFILSGFPLIPDDISCKSSYVDNDNESVEIWREEFATEEETDMLCSSCSSLNTSSKRQEDVLSIIRNTKFIHLCGDNDIILKNCAQQQLDFIYNLSCRPEFIVYLDTNQYTNQFTAVIDILQQFVLLYSKESVIQIDCRIGIDDIFNSICNRFEYINYKVNYECSCVDVNANQIISLEELCDTGKIFPNCKWWVSQFGRICPVNLHYGRLRLCDTKFPAKYMRYMFLCHSSKDRKKFVENPCKYMDLVPSCRIAIIGPHRSGKTTLSQYLARYFKADIYKAHADLAKITILNNEDELIEKELNELETLRLQENATFKREKIEEWTECVFAVISEVFAMIFNKGKQQVKIFSNEQAEACYQEIYIGLDSDIGTRKLILKNEIYKNSLGSITSNDFLAWVLKKTPPNSRYRQYVLDSAPLDTVFWKNLQDNDELPDCVYFLKISSLKKMFDLYSAVHDESCIIEDTVFEKIRNSFCQWKEFFEQRLQTKPNKMDMNRIRMDHSIDEYKRNLVASRFKNAVDFVQKYEDLKSYLQMHNVPCIDLDIANQSWTQTILKAMVDYISLYQPKSTPLYKANLNYFSSFGENEKQVHCVSYNSNESKTATKTGFFTKTSITYGYCLDWCPVLLHTHNVLLKGNMAYAADYKNKIYVMHSKDALTQFLSNPKDFSQKQRDVPPPRVYIIGLNYRNKLKFAESLSASLNVENISYMQNLTTIHNSFLRDEISFNSLRDSYKKIRNHIIQDLTAKYEKGAVIFGFPFFLEQFNDIIDHNLYPECVLIFDDQKELLQAMYRHYARLQVMHRLTSRVPVPDERFDFLCDYHKPVSKVPAYLNVVDIAGLVKGAAEGQGLGNAFLSHISACDAIFHLCRAFEDPDVTHVEGEVDPVRDLDIISEELRLKDVEKLLQNLDKLEKVVARGGDKKLKPEYDSMCKVKNILMDEKRHLRFADWNVHDIETLNKYMFLTSKPMIYLVNLSDKDFIRKKNKWLAKIKEWVDKNDPGAIIIPFSGHFEHDLAEKDESECKAYEEETKCKSVLDKIIIAGYKALQLEYFFTAGADEVKAWTIQKGTKAPQAAGRIHTDFEKGFIMAEVMHFKDFKEEGSEAAAKSAGKYRQQGRNYVVEDGDIIFFKFNAGAGLKDAKKK